MSEMEGAVIDAETGRIVSDGGHEEAKLVFTDGDDGDDDEDEDEDDEEDDEEAVEIHHYVIFVKDAGPTTVVDVCDPDELNERLRSTGRGKWIRFPSNGKLGTRDEDGNPTPYGVKHVKAELILFVEEIHPEGYDAESDMDDLDDDEDDDEDQPLKSTGTPVGFA